jgi:hypothetical protein
LAALVSAEKLLPGPKLWRLAIGTGLLVASVCCVIIGWWGT